MSIRVPFLWVVLFFVVSIATTFGQDARVSWQEHYNIALPDGFDPWCGPVVGVSGDTDVVVATARLPNGKPIDIYYPSETDTAKELGTVVFVPGNSDVEIRREEGRPWMYSNQVLGWGRLAAEHGLIAVAYENDGHPGDNLDEMGRWLADHGQEYGIDASDVGIWAASNSCAIAVDAFRSGHRKFGGIVPRFGVFFYGDLPLRSDHDVTIPLFVTCAEQDAWADTSGIERFVERLRERGGDVEFVIHTTGSHAFDVKEDTEETQAILDAAVTFMVDH